MDCDWLARYLGLDGERSEHQGLYGERHGERRHVHGQLLQSSVCQRLEHGAPCFLFRNSVPGRLAARSCLHLILQVPAMSSVVLGIGNRRQKRHNH